MQAKTEQEKTFDLLKKWNFIKANDYFNELFGKKFDRLGVFLIVETTEEGLKQFTEVTGWTYKEMEKHFERRFNVIK